MKLGALVAFTWLAACGYDPEVVNPNDACAGRIDGTVLCDGEPTPFSCVRGDKATYVSAIGTEPCTCSAESGVRPARCPDLLR